MSKYKKTDPIEVDVSCPKCGYDTLFIVAQLEKKQTDDEYYGRNHIEPIGSIECDNRNCDFYHVDSFDFYGIYENTEKEDIELDTGPEVGITIELV